MSRLELGALSGQNPLGLLAALGAVDGIDRLRPELRVRLSWTDTLVPRAVLTGIDSLDEVVSILDCDREEWCASVILNWGPDGSPLDVVKPSAEDARRWVKAVMDGDGPRTAAEVTLLAALFAEGAVDEKGTKTKPTHLDFTAGQLRFLASVRRLAGSVDPGRLHEALAGPWRYDSKDLPVLRWDIRGERVYALRATDPSESKNKEHGVPGADWLAFVGLSFFPVWPRRGKLVTTGCSERWKSSSLTWPLWSAELRPMVIRSLLRDAAIAEAPEGVRRARGIFQVLRAPIRRTDQGGYGSFGAPQPVVPERSARPAAHSLLMRER